MTKAGATGNETAPQSRSSLERRAPRVLSIAGTDPTGGAGIQADLKSIAANGGYGMAVVTALVAQNTQGVRSVHTPPPKFLRQQLEAVSDDVAIDAIKIGMLGNVETVAVVTAWLDDTWPAATLDRPPIVLDPVMIATSGDRLLAPDAEQALRELAYRADLITPNLPELAVLADESVANTWADALEQGCRVSVALGTVVLVKGGHLSGDLSPDALIDATRSTNGRKVVEIAGHRVATKNTHGTGCSLSSALATRFAQSGNWVHALEATKRWLSHALERADDLEVGQGSGPINHFADLWEAADTTWDDSTATETWWEGISDVRAALNRLGFVRGMQDGTLDRAAFDHYLLQDSLYLVQYARALSRASQLAPTPREQAFWAESAAACLTVELELHRKRLDGRENVKQVAHPTTVAYTNHLLAAAGGASYGVLVAAVLPCFWLYTDLGERLLASRHDTHPYGEWLDTYADPAFAASTQTAREITDRAASVAGADERKAMWQAFRASSWHEVAFFDMKPETDP